MQVGQGFKQKVNPIDANVDRLLLIEVRVDAEDREEVLRIFQRLQ